MFQQMEIDLPRLSALDCLPAAQRIERMIDETPIVDPHTHIRLDAPAAPDLAALMSYHWVQTELKAVGLPDTDADPALPSDERVRRAIPYLTRMRNTAMSWCLFRILRDLYDFHEPELTEQNYRSLLDRFEAAARQPGWARQVFPELPPSALAGMPATPTRMASTMTKTSSSYSEKPR